VCRTAHQSIRGKKTNHDRGTDESKIYTQHLATESNWLSPTKGEKKSHIPEQKKTWSLFAILGVKGKQKDYHNRSSYYNKSAEKGIRLPLPSGMHQVISYCSLHNKTLICFQYLPYEKQKCKICLFICALSCFSFLLFRLITNFDGNNISRHYNDHANFSQSFLGTH